MAMVMYKLLDKKTDEDSFFLNSNGTQDHEKKLDFTNTRGILNPFFIIDENGVRHYKRFIKGCPIYDPFEQDKQKIVFNLQSGLVQFDKGAPIVLDEIKGKVLITWLDMHPNNPGSPYHDPDVHEAIFFKHDPQAVLEKELKDVSVEDDAMDILRMLRKTPDRMRAVAMLFAETSLLSVDEQIYLGLREVAKKRPAEFRNSIASKESEVLSDVLIALKYHIINKDAKAFVYQGDNAVIMETTVKDQNIANNALVTYLMTKQGDIHYRNILVKIKQKEIELNAPAT